jgi:hypothetical protein
VKRLCLLLAAAAVSLSCSRVDLGWRAAPWLLRHEGAQWLGLRGAETEHFGKDADAWLRRAGQDIAPALAQVSLGVAGRLEAGDDEGALERLFSDLPPLWDRLLEPALSPLAAWMVSDRPARAAALAKTFAERNQRDLKRWSNDAKLAADREKRLRGGMKDWVGPLVDAQDPVIEAWGKLPYPVEGWRQDRLRRQGELLAALRRGDNVLAVRGILEAWWITPEKDRDPAYGKDLEAYRRGSRAVGLRLLKSLTPAQREYLVQRLRALGQDFATIAQRSAGKDRP